MNPKQFNKEAADEILISAAISGDKEALELLLKKHQDWIFNVALTFILLGCVAVQLGFRVDFLIILIV